MLRLCSDSCGHAKNGKCDEGRFPPKRDSVQSYIRGNLPLDNRTYYEAKCDLGTDCSDCGAWSGPASASVDRGTKVTEPPPITFLHSHNISVFTSRTVTLPPFIMGHAHPALDDDVSAYVDRTGILEGGITHIFREVLHKQCVDKDGKRALVLDIGANFGFFSVYAALLGCRVIAWEPVPLFRAFIRYNLQLNNVLHLVELRGKILSHEEGSVHEMSVPKTGTWGTASVGGMNDFPETEYLQFKAVSERLDSVVTEDVLMLKLDVEGYEPYVFRGLKSFLGHDSSRASFMMGLTKRKVDNIIMEYSPGILENRFEGQGPLFPGIDLLDETPSMLTSMIAWGYRIGHLTDAYAKSDSVSFDYEIPKLQEVTSEHLAYDIDDAKRYRDQRIGCPKPFEMTRALNRDDCNKIPEDLHPKSFHSLFPWNTNIWAVSSSSSSASLLKLEGEAALFGLDQDASRSWTSKANPTMGISYSCNQIEAVNLVRYRCNCSSIVIDPASKDYKACLVAEQAMEKLAAEGRLPFKP